MSSHNQVAFAGGAGGVDPLHPVFADLLGILDGMRESNGVQFASLCIETSRPICEASLPRGIGLCGCYILI